MALKNVNITDELMAKEASEAKNETEFDDLSERFKDGVISRIFVDCFSRVILFQIKEVLNDFNATFDEDELENKLQIINIRAFQQKPAEFIGHPLVLAIITPLDTGSKTF